VLVVWLNSANVGSKQTCDRHVFGMGIERRAENLTEM
jgi:hypothetical protein